MDEQGTSEEFEQRLRGRLREVYPAPEFPGAEIEKRIRCTLDRSELALREAPRRPRGSRWRERSVRYVLAAVASLVVFVAGVEYGRRIVAPTVSLPNPTDFEPSLQTSLPLSIQAAGSQYVASLARLSGTAGDLPIEQRRIAQEVAVTILYGAAIELLGGLDDESLRRAVEAISVTRRQVGAPVADGRF